MPTKYILFGGIISIFAISNVTVRLADDTITANHKNARINRAQRIQRRRIPVELAVELVSWPPRSGSGDTIEHPRGPHYGM